MNNSDPDFTASYEIEAASQAKFHLDINLYCPDCGEAKLVKNGTRKRKGRRIQYLECVNEKCPSFHPLYPRYGKQFSVQTSKAMQDLVLHQIQWAYESLYVYGDRGNNIARHTTMSEAWVSYLRKDLDEVITNGLMRDKEIAEFQLVDQLTEDEAGSIDETFFKIKDFNIYVIIVRGYLSRKVLAIHVSLSRKEADMKKAFMEAQKNTQKPLRVLTADAWGATEAMVRQLNQPMTLIMHRHKKPYDKAVIERIEYDPEKNLRIITEVGVPTDIFKTRAKRAFHYLIKTEPITLPPKKPIGRPKGAKDKKKRKSKKNPAPPISESSVNTESTATEKEKSEEKKNVEKRVSCMCSPMVKGHM